MTSHRLPLIANKLWSWLKKYLVYGKQIFFDYVIILLKNKKREKTV